MLSSTYYDDTADVKLISSDNVLFKVQRSLLRAAR
jgi:hypothetical protein